MIPSGIEPHDLQACSAVPQPTAPLCAPSTLCANITAKTTQLVLEKSPSNSKFPCHGHAQIYDLRHAPCKRLWELKKFNILRCRLSPVSYPIEQLLVQSHTQVHSHSSYTFCSSFDFMTNIYNIQMYFSRAKQHIK